MVFICQHCKKEFEPKHRYSNNKVPKFCSFDCAMKGQRKVRHYECKECGTLNEKLGTRWSRSNGKSPQFCNRTCASRWQAKEQIAKRQTLACKGCGEIKKINKSRLSEISNPANFFCKTCIQAGKKSFGNKWIDEFGYVRMLVGKTYPGARAKGIILEHRFVMQEKLGRQLKPSEYVHHKNGIRTDNRPENLELWNKKHAKGKRVEDIVAYSLEMLKLYAPQLLHREQMLNFDLNVSEFIESLTTIKTEGGL